MPTGVYKRIKPIWNKGKRYTLGRHCSEETIDETEIDTDDWERICLNKISNAMEVLNGKN